MSEATVTFGAKDKNLKSTIKGINREMGGMGKSTRETSKGVNMSFATMAKAGAALAVGFGAVKLAFSGVKKAFSLFGDSLKNAGNLQTMKTAFIPILGSADLAQKRIEELSRFAAQTPFEMPGILKASKLLQIFTKGVLATGDGLRMVGDVAAGVGAPIDELATWFGRLYDGIKNNGNIGDALARLQEFGALSGDVRRKIESLHKSGADFSDVWNVVEDSMGTFSGSMKLQSKTWNGVLSTLRDNWSMLLAKFGLPIIEKITPVLASIGESIGALQDKAEKLGKVFVNTFTGAGNAIVGFQTAVDAFKTGNISTAFKAVALAIKLQFAETANSIYARFVGVFAGVKEFLLKALGPGSAIHNILLISFRILGNEITSAVASGLKALFGNSPLFASMVKNIDTTMAAIANATAYGKSVIMRTVKEVPAEVAAAAVASKVAFREGFANAGELIDTSKLNAELDAIQKQIAAKLKDVAGDSLQLNFEELGLQLEIGKERVSMAERLLELETEIATAKANGNKEEEAQLRATKKYYQTLTKAKKSGLSMDKAMALAGKDYAASIKGTTNALEKQANAAKKIKEELGFAAKLAERIAGAQNEARGDGALKAKAEKELGEGNFAAARRTQRRLAEREAERDLRGEGNKRDKRHLKDIAKDEGIDTFGKDNKQIRDEIMDKRKEKAEKEAKEKKIEEKKKGKEEKLPEKAKENKLEKLAGDIFTELKSIGKKLPTHALGV